MSAPDPPAALVPADATPAALTAEQVAQAVAEAPLLAPEAARALLTEGARRGQAPGHALDSALYVASVGFPDLDRTSLDELGGLFARAWSARSAADQGRIQAYMQYARAGEPLSPESVAAGRALFGESVRSLPPASQARLTTLFATAVAAGIAHQQRAEERTRVAALTPLPAAETPKPAPPADMSPQARAHASRWPAASGSSGPGAAAANTTSEPRAGYASDRARDASTGGSESYWRSRAGSARSAVTAAEKRVRDLEEQATRGGPVVSGPLPAACQASAPTRGGHESGTVLGPSAWERTKNVVHCDGEILRQQQAQGTQTQLDAAREQLKRAQKALEALEDEARRAGALPGWLR